MKIINNKLPKRKISSCTASEAFKIHDDWYTRIQTNFDSLIDSDTADDNVVYFINGNTHADTYCDCLLPCIQLNCMALVFLSDEDEPEDWANIEAVLTG